MDKGEEEGGGGSKEEEEGGRDDGTEGEGCDSGGTAK